MGQDFKSTVYLFSGCWSISSWTYCLEELFAFFQLSASFFFLLIHPPWGEGKKKKKGVWADRGEQLDMDMDAWERDKEVLRKEWIGQRSESDGAKERQEEEERSPSEVFQDGTTQS